MDLAASIILADPKEKSRDFSRINNCGGRLAVPTGLRL
jgi:hypothetical protein